MIEPKVNLIDIHELKRRKDVDPTLCLIDVRELKEWQAMHIPGVIHIPKDELPLKITLQVPKLDNPIYLHCMRGIRSLNAAEYLLTQGYKEVYSVKGGIEAWVESGYPTEKQSV